MEMPGEANGLHRTEADASRGAGGSGSGRLRLEQAEDRLRWGPCRLCRDTDAELLFVLGL